jgi:hypothetical protein
MTHCYNNAFKIGTALSGEVSLSRPQETWIAKILCPQYIREVSGFLARFKRIDCDCCSTLTRALEFSSQWLYW